MEKSVAEFYSGKSVFVTGATGFIGKLLVEKLLWSCPNIENIFMIVRTKKDKDVKERLNEMLQSPAFDRIRANKPHQLKKIIAFEGDITSDELGMSKEDLEVFYDKVNVIFHSAASIKFNDPIKIAVQNNVLPAKKLLAMGNKVKQLDAFVHVSTAYSNSYQHEVEEMTYPPPYDPNALIGLSQELPDEFLDKIQPVLTSSGKPRGFPNTYTFTKYLAESIVETEGKALQRAIVRPSIVAATYSEPMPGWIDNWGGPTERMFQVALGTVHHMPGKKDLIIDYVPADMVINCVISAAYQTGIDKSTDLKVFNFASGKVNPVRIGEYFKDVEKAAVKYPLDRAIWYPGLRVTPNPIAKIVHPALFMYFPALILDFGRRIQGKKPVMFKLQKKLAEIFEQFIFFANNETSLKIDNTEKLRKSLSVADQKEFPFDLRTINWSVCCENYVHGIKKYLIKEDCSEQAMAKARQRMQRLKFYRTTTRVAMATTAVVLVGTLVAPKLGTEPKQIKESSIEYGGNNIWERLRQKQQHF